MITPTKTVCYAYIKRPLATEGMVKRRIHSARDTCVVTVSPPGGSSISAYTYSEIERIVVREEAL